jgi:hypothetical protein
MLGVVYFTARWTDVYYLVKILCFIIQLLRCAVEAKIVCEVLLDDFIIDPRTC